MLESITTPPAWRRLLRGNQDWWRKGLFRRRKTGVTAETVRLQRPFKRRGGHSWTGAIPDFLCNDTATKSRVAFRFFESDVLVTACSNAGHDEIATLGGGRHAFWTDLFCFSTTDNSDPNTNGRSYELRRIWRDTVGLWPLGGCTIYDPAYELEKSGRAYVCARETGFDESPYSHTIGEHLQQIDYLRGAFDIPTALRPFCNVDFNLRPGGFEAVVRDLDAVIIEECSDVEIVFRGVVLNRNRLADAIVAPAIEAGRQGRENKPLAASAYSWYFEGLLKASARREEFAGELLALMPHGDERNELLREIICNAEPRRTGSAALVDGVHRIEAVLGKPAGVLTHTQNYRADGRPIGWPRTLHDEIMETCRANGIPFMHPCELVERHGAKVALKDDLSHWRDDFMPVVAEAIGNFVGEVVGQKR